MDPAQFHSYQTLIKEKAKQEMEQRTQLADRAAVREEIKTQSKRVRVCDGSTSAGVREWIADIELTRPYLPADVCTNLVVANTCRGSLRKAFERFMSSQADRDKVKWTEVREHLKAGFLTADEDEYARSAMEKVQQTEFESTAAYARRFMEAADEAYPVATRNDVEERIILNAYIKGLKNPAMIRRLVQEARPTKIMQAVEAIERFNADDERLLKFGIASDNNGEEPMEIGAVGGAKPAWTEPIENITRQIAGLQKQFTKLMAMQEDRQRKTPLQERKIRTRHEWTPDGRPVCFKCHQAGHMGRGCQVQAVSQPGNSKRPQ